MTMVNNYDTLSLFLTYHGMTVADSRYELLEEKPGLFNRTVKVSHYSVRNVHIKTLKTTEASKLHLILTEATSIANSLEKLPASRILHHNSQVCRGQHNLQ